MAVRSIKVGLGIVSALVASTMLLPTAAHADYAPSSDDVVGVGSDTLQQLVNFVSDGDYLGDQGFNALGNQNKFISIDATADANSRLAYGTGGLTGSCTPGTGAAKGTGNQNANHNDKPCTLNPSVVLRAGTNPTQRPNGSGAGYNLLVADTNADGTGKGFVDFARASSPRGTNTQFDSVTIGKDPLQILASSTTNAPAGLSVAQLKNLYLCTASTWTAVGGTSSAAPLPLLPQIGSGTRSSFLSAIGLTEGQQGACVQNVEENDPEAIDGTGTTNAPNAIEPMSVSRLLLFQGRYADGTTASPNGYFNDPSCQFPVSEQTAPAACTGSAATLAPNVKLLASTGTASDGGAAFTATRSLYIYFRNKDVNSTKSFQPGGGLNWVRTMLYNPCSGAGHTTGCTTVGGVSYGPGGQPVFAQAASSTLISAAGVQPTAITYTASGP